MRVSSFPIVILTSLILSLGLGAQEISFKDPDFAYPATVEEEALAVLNDAAAHPTEAGPIRLRALLELMTARTAIDPDYIKECPGLIEKYIDLPDNTAGDKAMLEILHISGYQIVYSNANFKNEEIIEKSLHALARLDSLVATGGDTPLDRYSASLSTDSLSFSFFPDVAAFYAVVRPKFNFLNEYTDFYPKAYAALIEKMIERSRPGTYPFFYWTEKKISGETGLGKLSYLGKRYDIYTQYASEPEARYYLYELTEKAPLYDSQCIDIRLKVLEAIDESLKKFPDNYFNKLLEYNKKRLTTPTGRILDIDNINPLGAEIEINLDYNMSDGATIIINEVLGTDSIGKEVYRDEKKFEKLFGDYKSSFKIDKPGKYALSFSLSYGEITKVSEKKKFIVSDYIPFALSGSNKSLVVTAEAGNGSPVGGVLVSGRENSYNSRKEPFIPLGTTDKKGVLEVKDHRNMSLRFSKDGVEQDFNVYLTESELKNNRSDEQLSFQIITQRSLYHPGDTLSWVVVAGSFYPNKHLLVGDSITVTLKDANRSEVGRVDVITDNYGRADGCFILPRNGLTGTYNLTVSCGRNHSNKQVMVSDFKVPTFETTITSLKKDYPEKGSVTIEGEARTFSGMPVVGADVNVEVSRVYLWWLRRYDQDEYVTSSTATTDSTGHYTIELSAHDLGVDVDDDKDDDVDDEEEEFEDDDEYDDEYYDYSNYSYLNGEGVKLDYYRANITVTDNAGSTASTSRYFSTGKPYCMVAEGKKMFDGVKPYSFTLNALNADGKTAPININWALYKKNGEKPLLKGQAIAGTTVNIDLSNFPAGIYRIGLKATDKQLAKTNDNALSFVLYNTKRNLIPRLDKKPIFVPEKNLECKDGKPISYTIGLTEDAYIYTAVVSGDSIISFSGKKMKAGFHNLKTPEILSPNMSIQLFTVYKGEAVRKVIRIDIPEEPEASIETESFRDHLVPGDHEQWTIRLTDGRGNVLPAGAVATMYNRALEQEFQGNWPLGFRYYPNIPFTNFSYGYYYSPSIGIYRSSIYNLTFDPIPAFKFVEDMNLLRNGIYMRKYRMMNRSAKADTEDSLEGMELNEVVQVAYAASGTQNKLSMVTAAATSGIDEAVAEEAEEDGGEVAFREHEVLQAFWKPDLVSDSEGNINISFTVPNANCSWLFRSFAWTDSLQSASNMFTAVANKAVMVEPNLPRFLRQGDSATLPATVYNRTSSPADIDVTVEIFNPANDSTIIKRTVCQNVADSASVIVPVEITVATDLSAIGYRVSARLGSHTDGEQAAIPVLESACTVVESTEFYLNPEEALDVTVETDADSDLFLQYYGNPVYLVLQAMRMIKADDCGTAPSLVNAMFANAVVSIPAISRVGNIKEDSKLTENGDIKLLASLDDTPWVQTAANNTLRIQTLNEALNPEKSRENFDKAFNELKKLQKDDGGLCWGPWSPAPSEWITRSVLVTLGIARSLDCPAASGPEVDEFVVRSWNYICARTVQRRPVDEIYDPALAYIHSLFPHLDTDAEVSVIIGSTVKEMARTWKKMSVGEKAFAVEILHANGKEAEARQIMKSIRQFAVRTPDRGTLFPSVDDMRSYATVIRAYRTMGATSQEIDALRQWIVVQTQTSDDLFSINPDYIIAAVLMTGSDWFDAAPATISVTDNGSTTEYKADESGAVVTRLSGSGSPVRISATGRPVPAYGSVVSVGRKPMEKVEARPGRDISLTKRLLVFRDGKWVESSEYTLGERIKVELRINVERNMEYVTLTDDRPASFEPREQMPQVCYESNLRYYRENRDASTRIFIDYLPKGEYKLTYEVTAAIKGRFVSGAAMIQSQYAPEITARSGAGMVTVK